RAAAERWFRAGGADGRRPGGGTGGGAAVAGGARGGSGLCVRRRWRCARASAGGIADPAGGIPVAAQSVRRAGRGDGGAYRGGGVVDGLERAHVVRAAGTDASCAHVAGCAAGRSPGRETETPEGTC